MDVCVYNMCVCVCGVCVCVCVCVCVYTHNAETPEKKVWGNTVYT